MVDMLSAFDAVVEEGLIEEARKSNDFRSFQTESTPRPSRSTRM